MDALLIDDSDVELEITSGINAWTAYAVALHDADGAAPVIIKNGTLRPSQAMRIKLTNARAGQTLQVALVLASSDPRDDTVYRADCQLFQTEAPIGPSFGFRTDSVGGLNVQHDLFVKFARGAA